jgi:hypothetical protein
MDRASLTAPCAAALGGDQDIFTAPPRWWSSTSAAHIAWNDMLLVKTYRGSMLVKIANDAVFARDMISEKTKPGAESLISVKTKRNRGRYRGEAYDRAGARIGGVASSES